MKVFLLSLFSTALASNHLVDDSYLMTRNKRQTWYICGTFPNFIYSPTPCATTNQCTNGGNYLNVGCTNSAQCVPYHTGTVTCINGCCCTVPNTPGPSPNNRFGYCPSGQQSEVRCSGRGQCQNNRQSCMTGLCCDNVGNEFDVACGGIRALGSCTNGGCSQGVCTASNYCCECSVGRSAGRCNAGQCPPGYSCNSIGFCCASCPGNAMPFGQCRNGVCGGGRRCVAGNICC